jgi:hypothetical protein
MKYLERKDIPQSLKGITMTLPRKQFVVVEDTPYYPVVSRCVRRCYLCRIDAHSGKNYDLFLLLNNCSCVVLISYVPVTMQNSHTPGRRTVPSLSITTADGGLRTVFVFYRRSSPSNFAVTQ